MKRVAADGRKVPWLPLIAATLFVVVAVAIIAPLLIASARGQSLLSGGPSSDFRYLGERRAASSTSLSEPFLSEYKKLQDELLMLTAGIRSLEHRLRDEPQPPMINGEEFLQKERDPHRMYHPSDDDTLFVSIASFRDAECHNTIRDMMSQAKNPRRIFIGAVEQHFANDIPCTPQEYENCTSDEFCPKDNIRVRRVDPLVSKGPTFGRYVAMLMYRGEKYFMMIDSHNRFVRSWDARMIAMHKLLPTKKGVLSHYPNGWKNTSEELDGQGGTIVMCNANFIRYGYLRMKGKSMPRSSRPRPQPFSAAGFLFANAQLVREVPFDPYLDYIFDGEELLYSVRMWTHGYDIFAPNESLLFHYYYRHGAPRVWSHVKGWTEIQQKSAQRIQYLLQVTKPNTTEPLIPRDTKLPHIIRELDRYGLGKERTLEEYWKFAKVDPVHRIATDDFCDMVR